MKREYFLISIFFLISAIFFYLFYRIIIPFLSPIIWAAVFAVLFNPLYNRLLKRIHSKGLTSVLMCAIIVVLIIGPLTYLLIALVNEATTAVAKVNEMSKSGELSNLLSFNIPFLDTLREKLSRYYDISKINLNQLVRDAIDSVSKVLITQTSWVITNATKSVFYFFLMIFTMFYFFRDGEKIVHRLRRLMPLSPNQISVTFKQLRDIILATMYGGVVVALIQGMIGGVLFFALGIPSPVFWGAVMAFLSIIPFIGAFIVYIPAGIILALTGSYIKGLIVILVGTFVISQIDNVLRPFLISGKAALHPLLLFFTIMGGIAMFGLLGIVVGPIIAAIFLTLLKVFEFKLHPEAEPSLSAEDET
jgi:predicted PurR-regulated permease PerM